MKNIAKACEIKDAKISFVSLVDKAANKRQFLITKADDGSAGWKTVSKIIKADDHYVTGVVYEPLVEDSQGDFMTAEEIQKACYWFAKNGDAVDIQHNFQAHEGISVVENWVEKADTEIDGQKIAKGTWLVTAEITDNDIWNKIQKGEITGFSMGGTGKYSEEDVDLSSVKKTSEAEDNEGLLSRLAKALGFKTVIKGKVAELTEEKTKRDIFWNAVNALENCLYRYDWRTDKIATEADEGEIRTCLEDFCNIITNLLTTEKIITKAIAPDFSKLEKAGKKMSGKNKETLSSIYSSLGEFLKEFDEPEATGTEGNGESTDDNPTNKEETQVTKEETMKLISEEIAKAMNGKQNNEPAGTSNEPADGNVVKSEITAEFIAETIRNEIAKAVGTAEPTTVEKSDTALTADAVKQIIAQEIAKAVEPIRKSAGLPSNLNDEGVAKQDSEHYLHGIL